MPSRQFPVMLSAVLAATLCAQACGDGGTEPSPPPDPARPTTVTIAPATVALTAIGATAQLSAEVRDQSGNVMASVAINWSSGNATVASVDGSGLVTAAGNGATTVTATSGSASANAAITVKQTVSAVRVSPGALALQVGDLARMEAMALDSLDNAIAGTAFEWSSSDTTVAKVDGAGLVSALRVGSANVTAATEDWRDSSRVTVLARDPGAHHAALTAGVPERPFANMTVGGTQGSSATVGTLRLGLYPDVLPVIISQDDAGRHVLVAGSTLGAGRVVALPGQDFLSSGVRATLLGKASADRLLANAVRWAGAKRAPPIRVLVDSRRIADVLKAQGIDRVEVVGRLGAHVRDWSAAALADVDVAVVQANEWGTAHLVEESVAPLRTFAERGGGLVVAASALHWSWWIEQDHGPLTANALLRDTGISWNEDSIGEIESATTDFAPNQLPMAVWSGYIDGERLDPTQMAVLAGLFSTALDLGLSTELDSGLVRLVRETPPMPVPSSAPEARLAAYVGETLGPYNWPEPHPWAAVFPGLPSGDAERVNGTMTVDASRSEFPADASRGERHLPLGFYAPPSTVVRIEIPATHATEELAISVGELYDNLGPGYAAQPVWRRAPWLRREFPVTDRYTAVTNAYGGSIALIVPTDYSGTIPVTVQGAIPMAVYTAGRTSAGEWFGDLDAGAPQAIIQKAGGARFVISAERALKITDPGEVSAFWDGFQRHHADLAGEPAPRAYESIWIFDPQVGRGYANADPLRVNYPLHGEAWALVPGTAEGRAWIAQLPSEGPKQHVAPPPRAYSPWAHGVDWWLFGHELGHQWQTRDWGAGETYAEIGEVAVNLFTMYTLNSYIFGGGNTTLVSRTNPDMNSVDHAELANLRWPTADFFGRLSMYRQLVAEFGWEAMKRVFRSYYDPAYPRSTYGGELDGFAIRLSAVVERDLVGFFRHWEYPLSGAAATTILGFGYEEWLPPGW